MTFKPTQEQTDICDFTETGAHLAVEARAGAAKTTTLELIANLPWMKRKKGLSLAFNKKIAEEMARRLPSNFQAKTLNGLGYRIWFEYIGKKTNLDKGKTYRLLNTEIQKIDDPEEREPFYEDLRVLMDAVSASKAEGYVHGVSDRPNVRLLCEEEDFFTGLECELTLEQIALVKIVTKKSFDEMLDGTLDFDDMLLGPAICKCSFPLYDTVLVDEAQDLSPINHAMVKKLVRKRTQLIIVGDPCQAIYGFRGADHTSMDSLREMFDMPTMYLTTSFRCSAAVIASALWRAPDMKAPDWALSGSVRHPESWKAEDIPDGAAIICRNNAPLFEMALKLLADGRYPELIGRDIIKSLLATMKKFGKADINTEQALAKLLQWEEKELKRHKDTRAIRDRATCIRLFLRQAKTLGEAMELAKALEAQSGRIKLMTGHKAKGLEFDTVFFLDQELCRTDRDQDANLKYVIITRAKDKLIFVSSESYETKVKEEVV